MSYFRRVLCYACTESAKLLADLAKPTEHEEAKYSLAGWDTAGWLDTKANLENWCSYVSAKAVGGEGAPRLVSGWLLGKKAAPTGCEVNYNGTEVVVEGEGNAAKVAGAKNLGAYVWLMATGDPDANPERLCENFLGCTQDKQPRRNTRAKLNH